MADIRIGAYGAMIDALNEAVDAHAKVRDTVEQHAENHAQRRDARRRHLEVLHSAQKLTQGEQQK